MRWDSLTHLVGQHGAIARILVVETKGSVPREVGAMMAVWPEDSAGTIGGGRLEWEAMATARKRLAEGSGAAVSRHALGPELGQCCGGAVTLLIEVLTPETLPDAAEAVRLTPPPQGPDAKVDAARARMAAGDSATDVQLVGDVVVERTQPRAEPLWIWGAGHVGRALVQVLHPLEALAIDWIDTGQDRFPAQVTPGVTQVVAKDPAHLATYAPENAHHLIVTYSHDLDLDLCHWLLQRPFASAGLIGSATKWARFRKRLMSLGHSPEEIERITCPIGDPSLGKVPQAIAVSVASGLLKRIARQDARGTE
ncbi:MAG: xanthine dehydrogenase accessory protein XdhC [Rhodobacteraceae bacterium]|nr:xanthine dehydrogenase accessory protein XdhC [Paracoccaceae bacterium]